MHACHAVAGLVSDPLLNHHGFHQHTPDGAIMHSAPSPTAALPARRQFIRILGGGLVLAAGGGAFGAIGGCSSALPDVAVQPWQNPGAESDTRRFMLAHALLAPNPHNRQPWIADLAEPGRIHLVCDGDRLLPETDPFGRQILVGCGAFIELAVMAAAQRGCAVTVDAFPGGAPAVTELPRGVRVATLTLGAAGSAAADPLFAQIVRRHSNKTAYASDRRLPSTLPTQWAVTANALGLRTGFVEGEAAMAPIRRITREAYETECLTPRTWLESARLMRIGPQAIASHRDGISISAAVPRVMHAVGVFDPMEVPQRGASSLQRVMDRWAPFETGSGYLWLSGNGNSRSTQLAAGRAYVRLHLQATAAGVDMHPLSQALQEFSEVRTSFLALHRELGLDPARGPVQMLARVGYALAPSGPSPRRDLATVLRA
jgi:hypothetical protein